MIEPKIVTFSMRENHINLTTEYAKQHTKDNRSAALGNIIDGFFRQTDKMGQPITVKLRNNEFPLAIVVEMIGLGVKADPVVKCVLAWLQHSALPTHLPYEMPDIYESMLTAVKEAGGYDHLVEACNTYLAEVYNSYWFERSNHLALFNLLGEKVRRAKSTQQFERIVGKLHEIADMERDKVGTLCTLSSGIRFSVLFAFKEKILDKYPTPPEWVALAEKALKGMDEY